MSTTAQIRTAWRLGDSMLREIGGVGKLHKRSVERANFAVLRNPDIAQRAGRDRLHQQPRRRAPPAQPDYQNDLADALISGIRKYFAANPPLARHRQFCKNSFRAKTAITINSAFWRTPVL